MKKLVYLSLILATNCAIGQTNAKEHEWRITLRVIDEDGNAVAGAQAGVGYYTNSTPASIDGTTDTNGLFVASRYVQPSLLGYDMGLDAQKTGYYPTRIHHHLDAGYDPAEWQPTITLLLKKISNPIPMYAKSVRSVPPAGVESAGFDFMAGDWVSPNGRGQTIDMVVKRGPGYGWTIKFPNAGDGVQAFTNPPTRFPNEGSGLRSPHTAPEGGYESELVREEYNENRNYFFRVRTVLDHEGQVKSALYGKIYGDFMRFRYYLNPTPNDRNVEFDPKHNLLTGLKSFEQVSAP